MNELHVISKLRQYVSEHGGQKRAAHRLQISQPALSNIMNFKDRIPKHIASKLGYRTINITRYEPIK